MITGKVLYVDGAAAWRGAGARLWRSVDGGGSWQVFAHAEVSLPRSLLFHSRVLRRFLRGGFHHLIPAPVVLAVVDRSIWTCAAGDRVLKRVAPLHGSRPLSLATDGELVCYGEYRSNTERSPVHVWGVRGGEPGWRPLWRFQSVRHVHGVYYDSYAPGFWVTTGDRDEESCIWFTGDRFASLERVAGGSQQLRAVQLLFTRRHVYFGSDSPVEPNHLYRLDRASGRIERLQQVGSSVFHGCRVGEALFFSTAAEPSAVNRTRHAEVWGSRDGETWSRILELAKDRWPMRSFQYGQVLFPAGPGDGRRLWYSPLAVRGDQCSNQLALADLDLA